MPFTFAHPAIVLPFYRLPKQYFSLSGLIIGSLTPDFEYFIRLNILSLHSHTISGLFYFNLELGLLLFFFFHRYIRNPLILHLPIGLFRRFYPYLKYKQSYFSLRQTGLVSFSVLLGAFSHLLWDSFTHQGAFFVELLHLDKIYIGPFPLYRILQHLSTLGGFVFIAWFIFKMPVWRIKRPKNTMLAYWLQILVVTLVIWTILAICLYPLTIGIVVIILIDSFLLALFIVSLWNKRKGQLIKKDLTAL